MAAAAATSARVRAPGNRRRRPGLDRSRQRLLELLMIELPKPCYPPRQPYDAGRHGHTSRAIVAAMRKDLRLRVSGLPGRFMPDFPASSDRIREPPMIVAIVTFRLPQALNARRGYLRHSRARRRKELGLLPASCAKNWSLRPVTACAPAVFMSGKRARTPSGLHRGPEENGRGHTRLAADRRIPPFAGDGP